MTRIEKETSVRMLEKLQAKLDALYNEQEALKGVTGPTDSMKCGGKVKKMSGTDGTSGTVPFKPDWLKSFGATAAGIQQPGASTQFSTTPLSINPYSATGDSLGFNGGGQFGSGLTNATNPFTQMVGSQLPPGFGAGSEEGTAGAKFDWKNALYGLGVNAPTLYNLAQGMQKPEQMNPSDFYNPRAGSALSKLSQSKYDPNQALRQADKDYATGAYQNRTLAGGDRSTMLSNQGALMDINQRNKAGILDTSQKANVGYSRENAMAELGVGEGMAQTNWNVAQANAQNRAARRNYLGQAASDFSANLQNNRLMKNQQGRDEQLMEMYPDIFGKVAEFMPWLQNFKVGR